MTPQEHLDRIKATRRRLDLALDTTRPDMDEIQNLQQELDELTDSVGVAFRPKPIKRRIK